MCDLLAVLLCLSLSVEGNVKVQDTAFTAGSSGNWNVSFFSIALQLSRDLVGTEHGIDNLTVKSLIYGLYMWAIRVKKNNFEITMNHAHLMSFESFWSVCTCYVVCLLCSRCAVHKAPVY